jgi:hypothetical protein
MKRLIASCLIAVLTSFAVSDLSAQEPPPAQPPCSTNGTTPLSAFAEFEATIAVETDTSQGVARELLELTADVESSELGSLQTVPSARTMFREQDREGDGCVDYDTLGDLTKGPNGFDILDPTNPAALNVKFNFVDADGNILLDAKPCLEFFNITLQPRNKDRTRWRFSLVVECVSRIGQSGNLQSVNQSDDSLLDGPLILPNVSASEVYLQIGDLAGLAIVQKAESKFRQ